MSTDDPSARESETVDTAWEESLRGVLTEILRTVPESTSLGEIVDAARANPGLSPALDVMSVQQFIDVVKARLPDAAPKPARSQDAEDGPAVIRRRADAPDGDVRLLQALKEHGPTRDADLPGISGLTTDQIRLLVRGLKSRGHVHMEGTGARRKIRITRHGSAWLRKNS